MIIEYIFAFSLLFLVLVLPLILTVVNILTLFTAKIKLKRTTLTAFTIVYGSLLSSIALSYLSQYKWDEAVVMGGGGTSLHQPFSEDRYISLGLFIGVGIVSLLILDLKKILPPLAASLCVSGIYTGMIFSVFYCIQLGKVFKETAVDDEAFIVLYLYLYCLNYIICSVSTIRAAIRRYEQYYREKDIETSVKAAKRIQKLLAVSADSILFPLIGVIPLTGVLMVVCLLLGQGAFGIIKAFTETSDWTFSQMVSPPPVPYEGHYLCTVAVNGHERIVKPKRMGIRRGERIVVNRQLCIANAFEQLIEERAPKFHRAVRYIYDKYGYPISKHITTKLRADIVYIAMKPLEWLFLITLYLFDTAPESRIDCSTRESI